MARRRKEKTVRQEEKNLHDAIARVWQKNGTCEDELLVAAFTDQTLASLEAQLPVYDEGEFTPVRAIHPEEKLLRFLGRDPDESDVVMPVNQHRIAAFLYNSGYLMFEAGPGAWGSIARITEAGEDSSWAVELPLALQWHETTSVLDLTLAVTDELPPKRRQELQPIVQSFNSSGWGATASITMKRLWIFSTRSFVAGIHEAGLKDAIIGTINRCGPFLKQIPECQH